MAGDDETPLNATALVIALIALIGTIAQVLQQYYAASAAGYTNCKESVMGKWAVNTRRKFRFKELRFEVQFETPVIFVSPPTNKNGPVKDVKIHYVDGSDKSLEATRSLPAKEENALRRATHVHTADNERATWVTLLSALHTMERDSWEWRTEYYGNPFESPGPTNIATPTKMSTEESKPDGVAPDETPHQLLDHTLAIAVQVKQRSWDSMPAGVKKPYATTTFCHMLEIAAMLGIYWKEFDRSKDRYRAEGNGYILTGAQIPDLGLMFTFQVSGGNRFQENRVIPADEVKELCCGMVSTFFRADRDTRRLGTLNEDPRDLGIIQLGSPNEIAETMVLIDCNTITASYFRKNDTKHGHLFAIPFELLGMLCKNLHIKGTPFRMLPNPTPYHWDKKFFNLRKLVNEYHKKMRAGTFQKSFTNNARKAIEQFAALSGKVSDELQKHKDKARKLKEEDQNRVKQIQDRRQSLAGPPPSQSMGATTGTDGQPGHPRWRRGFQIPSFPSLPTRFTGSQRPPRDEENPASDPSGRPAAPSHRRQTNSFGAQEMMGGKLTSGYSMELLDTLDGALADCDQYLQAMSKKEPGLVRTVLREHFQEVLKMLNTDDEDEDSPPSPPTKHKVQIDEPAKARKPRKFDDLSSASPEDRQKIFMEIYFGEVLEEVKVRAAASFTKMTFYNKRARSARPGRESPDRIPTPASPGHLCPPIDLAAGDPSDAESDVGAPTREDSQARQSRQQEAAAIWCVFVFRMLCWLTLHDFDKNDIQVSKSELLGSRLPVYIS